MMYTHGIPKLLSGELAHNAVLNWVTELPLQEGMIARAVDLQTRTVLDMENSGSHGLGRLNEQYTRKLIAVAGNPEDVNEKVMKY